MFTKSEIADLGLEAEKIGAYASLLWDTVGRDLGEITLSEKTKSAFAYMLTEIEGIAERLETFLGELEKQAA